MCETPLDGISQILIQGTYDCLTPEPRPDLIFLSIFCWVISLDGADLAGVAGTDVILRVAHRWATRSIGTAQDGCGVGNFESRSANCASSKGWHSRVEKTSGKVNLDWLLDKNVHTPTGRASYFVAR